MHGLQKMIEWHLQITEINHSHHKPTYESPLLSSTLQHHHTMLVDHHRKNVPGDHLRPLSGVAEDAEFNFWSSHAIEDTWYYESPRPLTQLEDHTRSQSIADGRKQMMEMISNMPESSYELSLKDIVVEDQRGGLTKDEADDLKKKKKKSNDRKIKNNKKMGGQMVRISSMETEGLLIKSIFPTSSFSFKKREKAGTCRSKVAPDSSSEKPEIKKCWVERIFKLRSRGKGQMNSDGLSRWCKGDDILPSCWLSFQLRKCKNKWRQGEEGVVKQY